MANKFLKQREENVDNKVEVDSTTVIDIMVEEMEEHSKSTEFRDAIRSSKKKRELKTVHKNFLITETMNKKYKQLAKESNMNENELFIEILNNIFGES